MKEHIYTIPVTDGFREADGGCPFCAMYQRLDSEGIEYMMGPSYMEDDIRMDTNEQGFCTRHFKEMYARQNRLGLALMTHTHLQKLNADLSGMANAYQKPKLFKKPEPNEMVEYLKRLQGRCYICSKVDNTFQRYVDTFFYLWTREPEIVKALEGCNGFCLEHFAVLLEVGEKKLNASEYQRFREAAISLQLKRMKQLEDDVGTFIDQFDYQKKSGAAASPEVLRRALPNALDCLCRADVE